jgi:mercuric ion transport protein
MDQSVREAAMTGAAEGTQPSTAPVKVGLIGGALAAFATVLCWVVPLTLVSIGVTGVWLSTFTALAAYKWAFILAALGCMGYAGYRIFYRVKPAEGCEPDPGCAAPQGNRLHRVMFWVVSAFVLVLLVSPYLLPLFFPE